MVGINWNKVNGDKKIMSHPHPNHRMIKSKGTKTLKEVIIGD
tara:strand:+ start:3872 stop:3997 length:126 start_codon:yes stop_codon:yes gene_type:complete